MGPGYSSSYFPPQILLSKKKVGKTSAALRQLRNILFTIMFPAHHSPVPEVLHKYLSSII